MKRVTFYNISIVSQAFLDNNALFMVYLVGLQNKKGRETASFCMNYFAEDILGVFFASFLFPRFVRLPRVINNPGLTNDVDFDFAGVFEFLFYAFSDFPRELFCLQV